MTHLIKQINIELTAKLAISALLASAVIVTGANAIDTGIESQDRTHLEHKLWLEENATTDNDDQYESSQQAETARHANDVIAKAYGRQS
jgi:precorrin isomerase